MQFPRQVYETTEIQPGILVLTLGNEDFLQTETFLLEILINIPIDIIYNTSQQLVVIRGFQWIL